MFFQKKEMDRQAAMAFWNWFVENEEWIILQSKNSETAKLIAAIDAELTKVFPYARNEEIQFLVGANHGIGTSGINEFFFFHCGKRALKRDGEVLKSMKPDSLNWTVLIEK